MGARRVGCVFTGQRQHAAGHFRLAEMAVSRQKFNHVAIVIARIEVHQGVNPGRILAQRLFNHAHGLGKVCPVGFTQQAQARDAVAYGKLAGG
ncbi:hypothetical protein D3C71_813770 [compost metagenome]